MSQYNVYITANDGYILYYNINQAHINIYVNAEYMLTDKHVSPDP